jgi:formylglycine-generating enzyme required for sulfatase activity
VAQVLAMTMRADRRVTPVLRAQAGDVLARLGDPRPGVGLCADGLPDILWCEVPAGPFRMGSDEEQDPEADAKELPQHTVDLPAYYVSRYPVTQAQFKAFVDAGGYGEQRYWTEAAAKGEWVDGQARELLKDQLHSAPSSYGAPFDLPNHPVVGVTWYEALAYCRWLEEQLTAASCGLRVWRDDQITTLNLSHIAWNIRMPSEAEWEKAARGTDGRVYPWGRQADPDKANCEETGIGTTSAVGCFPGGVSTYGCLDMSGNVHEWTQSLWEDYPYDPADGRERLDAGPTNGRVSRGSAFYKSSRVMRCAYRDWLGPRIGRRSTGFRLAASPRKAP